MSDRAEAGARPRRIAIVGSGISGLYLAHLLHRSGDREITVFEKDPDVGGHVRTVDVELGAHRYAVDTGFIVCNDRTYPIFLGLLAELRVPLQPSDMSFSVHCESRGLEYAGPSFDALFAQRRNLLRPSFLGMIRDVLRFNREAPRLLDDSGEGDRPLGDWLAAQRYGDRFVEDYLVPMGAAIWSASPAQMLAFPARYFVRFFANHGMFSREHGPRWQVVAGGSRTYVRAIVQPFADRIRTASPVEAIRRPPGGGAEVKVRGGDFEHFDAVALACHSDEALGMLADPSDAERAVLGAIPYQRNEAVLHTDARLMPRRKRAWASWNYTMPERERPTVTVTYWMNRLQSLDAAVPFLVTLNRSELIDPAKVLRTLTYEHPTYTPAGVAAQGRHAEISGVRDTYYCGAWWRFGFHEDGAWSAQRVARQLGVEVDAPASPG
ncbi:MAG: FAD-dependent oxidoreductase [Planctomycetes bacterium]|nr:FAD-dependent oxidoreductase [Planctomycetota bacterium]